MNLQEHKRNPTLTVPVTPLTPRTESSFGLGLKEIHLSLVSRPAVELHGLGHIWSVLPKDRFISR